MTGRPRVYTFFARRMQDGRWLAEDNFTTTWADGDTFEDARERYAEVFADFYRELVEDDAVLGPALREEFTAMDRFVHDCPAHPLARRILRGVAA